MSEKTTFLPKQVFTQLPKQVRTFLLRALIVFIAWKLLYHLVLVPARVPDRPLTELTAASTAFLYTHLLHEPNVQVMADDYDPHFPKSAIFIHGERVIGIADPCNGLELYVLYIGFILCFPTTIRRQIAFLTLGIIGIYIANCFRCFGLAWLSFHHYSMADFAHKYLFKIILYAMIFYAWIVYSRKYFISE